MARQTKYTQRRRNAQIVEQGAHTQALRRDFVDVLDKHIHAQLVLAPCAREAENRAELQDHGVRVPRRRLVSYMSRHLNRPQVNVLLT